MLQLQKRKLTRAAGVLGCVVLMSASTSIARPSPSDEHSNSKSHAGPKAITGEVQVAREPAAGWKLELYAAGRDSAQLLQSTVSGSGGSFRFRPVRPSQDAVLYLLASKQAAQKMLVVLGHRLDLPERVVVNELATVASVWTSAQFIDGDELVGNLVGLAAAARNVPNLVDLETGGLGRVVQNDANGLKTTTLATLNTLASILADCLRTECGPFFSAATLLGEARPADSVEALANIARNPWNNVALIYRLRPSARDGATDLNPVFIPTLLWPPTGWTLSLVYSQGGFNAPGGMSIDAEGNLWTNNNFLPGSQSILADINGQVDYGELAYTGTGATKLASNGEPLSPPTGFLGGGIFGGAYGVAIDEHGKIWLGNFGGDSVSKLNADGTSISPDSDSQYSSSGGYKHRSFDNPQSLIVDRGGSIWVSNIGVPGGNAGTVTELVGGDPKNVRVYGAACGGAGFKNPWGLASDAENRIWVTNFSGDSVSVIDRRIHSSCPAATYPLGRFDEPSEPQGVAVDSAGNVWVARTAAGRVSLLEASKGYLDPSDFTAERTIVGPWGVAVDGKDNLWVADFFGKRVHNLCGVAGKCPGGVATGEPISPTGNPEDQRLERGGGYGANAAVQSITSVVVDQAGNVWLANNFDDTRVCLRGEAITPPGAKNTPGNEHLQARCGGNGAVVIFGVAAPVAAPLIGAPVQP